MSKFVTERMSSLSESGYIKEAENEAEKLASDIKKAFKKHFPKSLMFAEYKSGISGHVINIRYTLGSGKSEYNNGIWQNDPIASSLFIYGFDRKGSGVQVDPKLVAEMVMGGTVSVNATESHYAFGSVKVWRKISSKSPNDMLKSLDKYFAKLKQTVKDNADNMDSLRLSYDVKRKV